jgi:hypothetical protein
MLHKFKRKPITKYIPYKKITNPQNNASKKHIILYDTRNTINNVVNPSSSPLVSPLYYPIIYNNKYINRRVLTPIYNNRFAIIDKSDSHSSKCEKQTKKIKLKNTSLETSKNKQTKKNKDGEEKIKKRPSELSKKLEKKKKKIDADRKLKRERNKKLKYKVNYSKLDSKGDPSVSFVVKSKRRAELMAILNAKIKGKGAKKENRIVRTRTIRKLGKEFARIYIRYRNMLLKSKGSDNRFILSPGSEELCQKAALQCIYHDITPRQLLEYWDIHISEFAPGNFVKPYPPLSFLTSVYASEQVSMALFEKTTGGSKKWSSGDFNKQYDDKNYKNNSHSFFDVEQLDKRLRHGLIDAGFNLGDKYDNRYLLTVQKTALAIVHGKKIFVAGKLKEMVDWAIDNLYGGECE